MIFHRWHPIKPPDRDLESFDFSEINSLQRRWLDVKDSREAENPDTYKAFSERLERRWAIETGIIEGIYDISQGMTQTLVEHGLSADLIDAGSTNKNPQELVAVLQDHVEAAEFVTESIRRKTPFSKFFIQQLHQILTRHQPTYTAVDQFGTVFETPLDRGGFKTMPNNPTRRDGAVHEYCPPIQVESELDSLVCFYAASDLEKADFHPLLVGAWLHHRFTQIHPFQDGNGRVARALLTWHLVKEGYWPIVVSRDDREHYITCLEQADAGDLTPFVDFLVQQEKQTILQALSEPEPAPALAVFDQVLDHIVQSIQRKQRAQEAQLRSVNGVAGRLRDATAEYFDGRGGEITRRLETAGMVMEDVVVTGGPEDKEHYWRSEVIETANNAGQWVNWNENKFFVQLSVSPAIPNLSGYPRLVFVVSLHHVGRTLTGIMEATSFALITHYPDQSSDELLPSRRDFHNCTVSPFTFTNEESFDAVSPRFIRWAEEHLTIALTKWGEYLT